MRRSSARLSRTFALALLLLGCPGDRANRGEAAPATPAQRAAATGSTSQAAEADPAAEASAKSPPHESGRDERPAAPEPLADDAPLGPGELAAIPEGSRGRTTRSEAPPLTSVEVLTTLSEVLAGGEPPGDIMWLSRAAAAIDRDPKLGEQIVDRIISESQTTAGREFGVQLLTATGTAQAPLRRLLRDPKIRADRQFIVIAVQPMSMPRPEDATVELYLELRESEEQALHSVATKVLGHQIATLLSSGREDAALRLAETLKAKLKAESEIAERVLLLESLGAGGLPQTLPFIRSFARDQEPGLRAAAAKGLLLDDSPKGNKLLLRLVVDPAPEVQAAAIESLHYHDLSAAQQRTFHQALMSDRMRPPNDGVLVHVVDRLLNDPARKQALEHLLARNKGSWVERHITNVLAK